MYSHIKIDKYLNKQIETKFKRETENMQQYKSDVNEMPIKEKEIKDLIRGKSDVKQDEISIREKEIKDLIRGFVGRDIVVTLRNKKSLKGKLESVTNYELLLTVSHEPVLIMKHAIDYIELTKTIS